MTSTPMLQNPIGRRAFLAGGTAAVAAALAGCGATASNPADASAAPNAHMTGLTWGDAKYMQDQFGIYRQNFPSQAKQQTLSVTVAGQNDSDAVTKFRLALSAHQNIPDIVELNYDEVAEFAYQNQLTDISSYVSDYLSSMTGAAKTLMRCNGAYVAFPYEVKEKLWYYRKDMFAAVGIDPATVKTQADFVAAGRTLRGKYPKSFMWNIAPDPQTYVLGEITSGNGAQIYDKNASKFVVDTDPGVRQAFMALRDLRESGVVATEFDDFTPDWQSALADGTLASVPIASWFSTFLPEYAPALAGKWGVTTWPEIGGAIGGSESGGSVFVIPAASQNQAAAARFLADTFMTKQGSVAVAKQSGEIPNVTSAQEDPSVTNDPYFGIDLMTAFQAANKDYKIFGYDPAALAELTILQNALANYLSGGTSDPTSALQAAQQQMAAQIGDPYQQQ
jgi:ABC-type glycerol-3-phosphate transport system substrate-binding protein